MRKHGVTNFPDPNGQGVITFHSGIGIDPSSPAFQVRPKPSATSCCPNGGQPTPAQIAKKQAAAARLLDLHARARAQGLPRPVAAAGLRIHVQTRQRPRPEQLDLPERHSRPARGSSRSRAAGEPMTRALEPTDAAARRVPARSGRRLSRRGRRLAAALGVLIVVVGGALAVAVADPFASGPPAASGVADNGAATSLDDGEATGSVAADAGERHARLCGRLDDVGTERDGAGRPRAGAAVGGDRRSRRSAADQSARAQAQALLDADLRKVAVDCRGANAAAERGSQSGGSQQGGGSAGACATDAQAVTADRPERRGRDRQGADRSARALGRGGDARRKAKPRRQRTARTRVYTMLPKVGQIVRRGEPLYAISGEPALLLYGGVPASRAFVPGMSAGADVAELNRNLSARLRSAERRRIHRGDDACDRAASSPQRHLRRPGSCRSGRWCSSREPSG